MPPNFPSTCVESSETDKRCRSPIMSIAEIFPTMVIVKMGMFPRIPQPECESFALHRHPWQGKHGDLTQFEIVRGGKKLGE